MNITGKIGGAEVEPNKSRFTLWCWPYFQTRDSAKPVLSGLTIEKAEEIIEKEKERAPGILFIEETT